MSFSKHIYYADSKYPRTVILHHGSSETTIFSDSDDKIKIESPKYNKIWMNREGWIPEPEEEKISWLYKVLQRAKNNGDLI
jgi:hypothetical protein